MGFPDSRGHQHREHHGIGPLWPASLHPSLPAVATRRGGGEDDKALDKIRPQMLQNKASSTVLGPYFCSYFCLVCAGRGFQNDSPTELGVAMVLRYAISNFGPATWALFKHFQVISGHLGRPSISSKQTGRERKGPPEIIQKFRLRNWPISSADFGRKHPSHDVIFSGQTLP